MPISFCCHPDDPDFAQDAIAHDSYSQSSSRRASRLETKRSLSTQPKKGVSIGVVASHSILRCRSSPFLARWLYISHIMTGGYCVDAYPAFRPSQKSIWRRRHRLGGTDEGIRFNSDLDASRCTYQIHEIGARQGSYLQYGIATRSLFGHTYDCKLAPGRLQY